MNQFESYGQVLMGEQVFIGKFCTLACPKEQTIRSCSADIAEIWRQTKPVRIGNKCIVNNYVCIHEGTSVGPETLIEDHVRVGYDCQIGANTRIMYGAYICDRVTIGHHARIAGFICDASHVGDHSTVMGNLVHEYTTPHGDWWEVDESSPIIRSNTVIGFGATIVGGIEIGPYAYVAAGTVVTKSIPSRHIVCGINQQIAFKDWHGNKLASLLAEWEKT